MHILLGQEPENPIQETTMANKKDKGIDHSAAHPQGWPGIPGRSEEHERTPEGAPREAQNAGVTEAQRGLEREQHEVERK